MSKIVNALDPATFGDR